MTHTKALTQVRRKASIRSHRARTRESIESIEEESPETMGAGQRMASPPAAVAVPLLLLFVVPFCKAIMFPGHQLRCSIFSGKLQLA